ncbi:MAG: hypothetical protein PHF17_10655, partial [Arcobacteraceae bacterium]|nr:hypothetical protein [Arcobacteraceae bacterium]
DVNVISVNDGPTLSTISKVIVYKNSGDKNITVVANDVDGDNLTYSAIVVDNTIVQSAIFTNNILTVKSIATGNSDINVTVTDGNLTTSKIFNFYVLPLEDGEDARVNDINQTVENNTTTTSLNINDDLTVKIQEGTNGKVSHDIIVNGKEIKATSQISGSVVAFTSNGVKTTYSDNTTDIEVDASLDGKAIHTLTSNGKTTKATSQFVGAQTVIKKDNNNKIEIETSVVIDGNTTVKVTAKEDGTAEHIVTTNGKTSTALSKIAGAQTTITTSGQIDTEVINKPTTCSGEYIKAKVSTFANGKAQTKFVSYKCSDNSEIREVKTNTDATPYAPNNNVIIESSNGSTQIITTTPLEDNIRF